MSFDTTQLLELKSRSFEAVKKEIEELIELIINDDPDGYLGNTYLKLVHEDKDGIPTGANILFLDGKDLGSMIFIIKDGREVQFNKSKDQGLVCINYENKIEWRVVDHLTQRLLD